MGNRGYTVSQYIIESTELCNYECSVILECVPSLRPDILSKSFNKMYEDVNLSDYMNNVKIFCERDVFLIEDFLDFYSEDIIEEIYNSYEWKELTIHGSKVHRYVDVQGVHDSNGHIPIYRNPGDQYIAARYPDRLVMKMIETLNCTLPTLPTFNHAYLKFYTQSKNGINAHTDKTLDLNNNSYIANLSFGYTKSMTFTNKITHEKVIVQMKSNSCLLIGMKTNRKWLHEVKGDYDTSKLKLEENFNNKGRRLSITIRSVGTFHNIHTNELYGLGASISATMNDDREMMLKAFTLENKSYNLKREDLYPKGFSALST